MHRAQYKEQAVLNKGLRGAYLGFVLGWGVSGFYEDLCFARFAYQGLIRSTRRGRVRGVSEKKATGRSTEN